MLRLLTPAAVTCACLSHLVLAQETAHPATTQPECARRYQDTRYVSWVCDTDGSGRGGNLACRQRGLAGCS